MKELFSFVDPIIHKVKTGIDFVPVLYVGAVGKLGEVDWKDTLLKVLLGGFLSSAAWWSLWVQDVATKQWVEANPPILRYIPGIVEKIKTVGENDKRLDKVEITNAKLESAIHTLEVNVVNLQVTIRELTKELKRQGLN